jgi:hypothetical protein
MGVGGGVEKKSHQNNLSENILQVKFNCTPFPWPTRVGGYMRGVQLEVYEKKRGSTPAQLRDNRVVRLQSILARCSPPLGRCWRMRIGNLSDAMR